MKISHSSFLILSLICTCFLACKPIFHIADINEDRYEIEPHEQLKEDSTINAIIKPYKAQLQDKMNRVIGTNAKDMYKARPEGELGNWVADILYSEVSKIYDGKLDFAVQNHGGLRIPVLNEGPITVRDIYEIMPFDNEVVVIKAKGVVIQKLFERIAEKGGWPVSKQINMLGTIDNKLHSLTIDSVPFDPKKTYTFALPDYVANGGDKCDFLINQKQIKFNLLVRDAIINHLDSEGIDNVQFAQKEGRIKFTQR